jgi:hypothetical protein
MGFLEEGNKCPRGVWSRLSEAVLTVVIGAALGIALCYAIEERPVAPLVLAAAALGGVLASAVRQATSSRI